MKLTQIIEKYEPLGWNFEYTTSSIENFWTFKSPRMQDRRGFSEHRFGEREASELDVNENLMLENETKYYIWQTYSEKIKKAFRGVREDIIKQLEILDSKKLDLPDSVDVKFTLNLK